MTEPNNTNELREQIFQLTALTGQKFMKTKVLEDWTLAKDIMELVEKHSQRIELQSRIEAYKHLNFTYWDDKTDSIPCADIDNEITELKQQLDKLNKGGECIYNVDIDQHDDWCSCRQCCCANGMCTHGE